MEGSLITKEAILNEFSYVKENFFQQLLEKSVESDIITIEEGVKYRDSMAQILLKHAYEVTTDVESMIKETRELVIKNHFYILSLYLSTFKPAEALLKVKNTSSFKLHGEAVRWFERTLSEKCIQLKKFEDVVKTSKEMKLLMSTYNSILSQYKLILNYDNNFIDLSYPIVIPEYSLMSGAISCSKDIVVAISTLSKSFMIEVMIRNKFDRKVIRKIKQQYSDLNKEFTKSKIESEAMEKEADLRKRIRTKIERKYADMGKDDDNFALLFGAAMEDEFQSELEMAMEGVEHDKEEQYNDVDSMFELDNMLVNTLVELVCVLLNLEFPKFKNPSTMPMKYKALNIVPKEVIFEVLFNHEEIIKFSDEEKAYLQEYFLQNLVTVEQ